MMLVGRLETTPLVNVVGVALRREATFRASKNGVRLKMSRKEAFEREVEAQLRQISVEIQQLLDQVDEAGSDAESETIRAIEEICDRWTDAERERNRVRTAGEEGWEHLQSRLEAALDELRSAMEPTAARLRRTGTVSTTSVAGPRYGSGMSEEIQGH